MEDRLKEVLKVLSKLIERTQKLKYRPQYKEGVYAFLSYDLVNSTEFKEKNDNWPELFERFYDHIQKKLTPYKFVIWKHIGDEVLSYKRLSEIEDLYTLLPDAYNVLISVIDELESEMKKDNYEHKENVSVKACLWIAKMDSLNREDYDNVFVETLKGEKYTWEEQITPEKIVKRNTGYDSKAEYILIDMDFLGPEIDLGFRISKFAEKRRLVVDAKLALILYNLKDDIHLYYKKKDYNYNIVNCLKIVSYEKLKGAVGGKIYPILWYENDWSKFRDSLTYDEPYKSDIIKNIIFRNILDDSFENSEEKLKALDKIFQEIGIKKKVDKLENKIYNL